MSGTGKRRDPAPGLLRERKRRKRDLAKLEGLKRLVEQHQQDERVLQSQLDAANSQLESLAQENQRKQREIDKLCHGWKNESEMHREYRVGVEVRVSTLHCERQMPGYMAHLVKSLMGKLREDVMTAQLLNLVQSPLMLEEAGDAGRMLLRTKNRWIHQVVRASLREAWFIPDLERVLSQFWDSAMDAIKTAALAVPPGTKVRWVDERPMEMVMRAPIRF